MKIDFGIFFKKMIGYFWPTFNTFVDPVYF